MTLFLQSFLASIIDRTKDCSFQYQTEYGPYLKKNPTNTSESFYRYMLSQVKKYITKETIVLDTGCGLGRLTIDTANLGAKHVTGVDTDGAYLHEAAAIAGNHRQSILSYPCHGKYDFRFADIEHLPFENEMFSLALCINVIDRIKYPKKALHELFRVLKNDGVVVLCDPYDWVDSVTPVENRVADLKDLLPKIHWKILFENDKLPYALQIKPRRQTIYENHLVIARKK